MIVVVDGHIAKKIGDTPLSPEYIISITAVEESEIDFKYCKNVLHLHINDIIVGGKAKHVPCVEDMVGLKEFVDSWDKSKHLMIHCFAGISRSTGLAKAISDYTGVDVVYTEEPYHNPKVYVSALTVLGLEPDKEVVRAMRKRW